MTDLDDRDAGFYWISVDGQPAEVALWQLEWTAWLVVGRDLPLTDEVGIEVRVLSACLVPPQHEAALPLAGPNNDL